MSAGRLTYLTLGHITARNTSIVPFYFADSDGLEVRGAQEGGPENERREEEEGRGMSLENIVICFHLQVSI